MAAKIIIHERLKYSSYFEVNYTFVLDVPLAMQRKGDPPLGATKTISGKMSYSNGTTASFIKADLIKRYNEEQVLLDADTTYTFYGTIWDGSVWI